jgi:predicted Zn-dependent protease
MRAGALLALLPVALLACLLAQTGHAQFPGIGDIGSALSKAKKTADETAKVAKGASGLSLEEEIAIGDAVSIAIVTRYGGVWRDAAATRRVNLIGRILAQYATRQDLDWRFGLLNSDAINAFSAPGGRVFITRGLYQILPKDDELAGVLAHEIIHIDQRHAVNNIARNEMLSGFSGLLADNSGSFGQFVQVVDAVADEILVTGYDPDTEFDADAGGHDLADTTGFAPGGLRAALLLITTVNNPQQEVLTTHPPIAERLQRLPDDPPP